MLEPIHQLPDDLCRYHRCFRIETDRMEPVRRQRQHVLFPARQEQRVAFGRQLFQPETIIISRMTAVHEPYFRFRAVHLHAPFPHVPKYRFYGCGRETERFPVFRFAPVFLQRLHPVSVQHRFRYPVPSPILQFLFRERLLHRPVRAWLVFRLCRPFFRPGRFCRSVTVHPVSFRQRDNPHGSLPFPYRFRRYILADTQTQLTVYRFQYLHEVGGVLAVQPLDFRHDKETVARKVPVPEVFHPVRFATAVIIHVARSLAVLVQRVQEIPAYPPLHGQVVAEHVQPVTRPCQYFLFSYHTACIYVHAKGVVQSSGRSACRAFPASTVPGTVPRPCGGSGFSSRRWRRR